MSIVIKGVKSREDEQIKLGNELVSYDDNLDTRVQLLNQTDDHI